MPTPLLVSPFLPPSFPFTSGSPLSIPYKYYFSFFFLGRGEEKGRRGSRSPPELFLRPKEANHWGPRRRMVGDTATVSTFVTVEGQPYSPTLAGKGGLRRGFPCFPSRLSISAVSSPVPFPLCS